MMLGTYQGLGLRALLAVLGVASFASGYLIFRKSARGSIVALATVLAGLAIFTALRLPPTNFVFSDYVLYALLAGDLLVGWITWNRIRSIRASRWHPMDMPAYG